jgi:hypothetical protein
MMSHYSYHGGLNLRIYLPIRGKFGDFIRNDSSMVTSQAALAKEVLAEIPEQFLQYMKKRGVKPKPRTMAPPM